MRKGTIKISTNNALHFLIIPASEPVCEKHPQKKKVPAHKGPEPQHDPGVYLALKARRVEYFAAFEILYINVSGKRTRNEYQGFSLVMTVGLYFQKRALWLKVRAVA